MELNGIICRSGKKIFSVLVVALLPVYAGNHEYVRVGCKLNLAWLVQCVYQHNFAVCLGKQEADPASPCVTGLGMSVVLVRDPGD